MEELTLADSYKLAKISITPDQMRLRQEAFDKVAEGINDAKSIYLTRLYFSLPVSSDEDWFRASFAETDASFSMVDNAREAAVLASSLLYRAAKDGKEFAGVALLAAFVAGHRKALVNPELLPKIREILAAMAVNKRMHSTVSIAVLKAPAKTKISAESLAQAASIPQLAPTLQQLGDYSSEITGELVKQISPVLKQLTQQQNQLREEVDLLWWFVGGFSRLTEKPFGDMDVRLAAVLAGLDLSDLSHSISGPVSGIALLNKILLIGREAKQTKATLDEIVSAVIAEDSIDKDIGDVVETIPDICPVLYAVKKAREIGASPSWHEAFRKASFLSETASFLPLELAVQVARERSIVREL